MLKIYETLNKISLKVAISACTTNYSSLVKHIYLDAIYNENEN